MITTPPVREVKIPVCDVPDKIRKWPSFRIGNEDGHFFNASEDNEPKIIELLMNKRFLCLFWHVSEAYDGWIQRDESWEPETIVCERFARNGGSASVSAKDKKLFDSSAILDQSLFGITFEPAVLSRHSLFPRPFDFFKFQKGIHYYLATCMCLSFCSWVRLRSLIFAIIPHACPS